MAVMARTRGIPARVAVGFLTPDQVGPDQWQYSAWDLHAWPGSTSPARAGCASSPLPPAAAPRSRRTPRAGSPRSRPSDLPASSASNDLPTRGPSTPADRADSQQGTQQRSALHVPWRVIAGIGLGMLVVGLVLALPGLLRRVRRERRWARSRVSRGRLGGAARHHGRPGPQLARRPLPAGRGARPGRSLRRPDRGGEPGAPSIGPEQNPTAVAALDRIVGPRASPLLARRDGRRHGPARGHRDVRPPSWAGPRPAPGAGAVVAAVGVPAGRRAAVAHGRPGLVGAPGHPERVVDHVG
ncbi:MAG: transglutaminase domain-containing protein [Nocardioides sp.]